MRCSQLGILKFGALVAFVTVFACGSAQARTPIGTEKKIGVGLGGGTMTSGITAKYYLNEKLQVQAVVGGSGWGIGFGADAIQDVAHLVDHEAGSLKLGVGGGLGLVMYSVGPFSATVAGVSGVVQVGWQFSSIPLEIVTDWRPTFFIGDYLGGLYLGGGSGAVRWYF